MVTLSGKEAVAVNTIGVARERSVKLTRVNVFFKIICTRYALEYALRYAQVVHDGLSVRLFVNGPKRRRVLTLTIVW